MKINRFQQLKVFYGVALAFIALTLLSSHLLMQHAVQGNEGDARVINLSGRQRMLSQRLTKCILALDHLSDDGERAKRLHEISESLAAWKSAHLGLQHGDKNLGLPARQNSNAIKALFAEMEPFHSNMVHALEQMMAQVMKGGPSRDAIPATVEVALRNEPRFLELMDKITFQFDKEAKERIETLQKMERGSLLAGLLVLVLEFLFVFRPSLSHLAEMMNSLQRRTEEALSANEQVREDEFRLRTILQTAMDGFCRLDMQGRLLEVNESYCRMSGYGEQELIGKPISIMEAREQPDEIAGRIRKIKERGWERFESVQRRQDGSHFDVEVCAHYQPIKEGSMFIFVKDISERKRAEEALRSSEYRFRAMIDASPVPFGLNDEQQNVTFLNKAFTDTFGYEVADIPTVAQWWPKAYPDAEYRAWVAGEWCKRMNKAEETGAAFDPIEVNIRCKDGSQRITMVSMAALGQQGIHLVVLYDITKRKQEEIIAKRLVAIVESSDDAIIGENRDSIITSWNRGAEKIFGYAANEMVGTSIIRLIPADRQGEEDLLLEKIRRSESVEHFETVRQAKDGRLIHVSVTASPIKDASGQVVGVSKISRDITERKRMETSLRQSEARFRRYFELPLIGIAITSPTKGWLEVNDRLCAMMGYSRVELQRMTWVELTAPEDLPADLAQFERLMAGEIDGYQLEKRFVCKNGRSMPADLVVGCVRTATGALDYVVALVQDITDRKIMEEKLLRSQRMESIGTLASGVAHDLNNIIAPILLSAELLREAHQPEARECLISSIEECAQRGAAVVNQVLTFARGAKGESVILQLPPLIAEMEKIGRETFPKNIAITSSIPCDLWPVKGNSTQIHQVLLNLCINARDAMPEGGALHLAAENTEIDENFAAMVPDAKAGDYAVLAVTDTGMGIAREIVLKVFDPFFTTKEVGKGTGLGLSTVAGIVRSHGGFVTVESEVGRGTNFKVFLPRGKEGAMEQKNLAQHPVVAQGAEATILVVDDEVLIAKTISMVLKNNGYRIHTAFDGNEALAIYREHAHEIDLVLTDVMMPGMDGVALSRALKEINPRVKILASTGQASESSQAQLHALGVENILHKPYDAKKLIATLHTLF